MGVNKVVYGGKTLIDLSSDTLTANNMLYGITGHNKAGDKITGSMPNNGSVTNTLDGITTKSIRIPAGYTSGGTISLTGDVDDVVEAQADLISQIISLLGGEVSTSATAQIHRNTINLQTIIDLIQSHPKLSETVFTVNHETGQLEYTSSTHAFTVNEETGELEYESTTDLYNLDHTSS